MTRVRFLIEAAFAYSLWGLFRLLPVDAASWLGGALLRRIGPLTSAHRVAADNLRRALPDLDDARRRQVLRGMWDNLGRVVGELPHMARICDPASGRLTVSGGEYLDALRDSGKPGILISGHLGNWQLQPFVIAARGLIVHVFYRAPNNPLVDRLFRVAHSGGGGEMLPKGRDGARRSIELLKNGAVLGMLADQKMNDGIAVPFFGRPAMTVSAPAQLALKYHAVVLPGRMVRLGGARFRMEFEAPMDLPDSGDLHGDVAATMAQVNQRLEDWIREYPEQWLWVHRRWPKESAPLNPAEKHTGREPPR